MSTPGERMAAEMAEQEAQEQEWRVTTTGLAIAKEDSPEFFVMDEPQEIADYLNKAQQEVRELREELARVADDEQWSGFYATTQKVIADLRAQLQGLEDEKARVGLFPSDSASDLVRHHRSQFEAGMGAQKRTIEILKAQLQAAEAERERQQRANMQMADAYAATKFAMLHDLRATNTLLQQAREALKQKDSAKRLAAIAAIDAHEKAGRE